MHIASPAPGALPAAPAPAPRLHLRIISAAAVLLLAEWLMSPLSLAGSAAEIGMHLAACLLAVATTVAAALYCLKALRPLVAPWQWVAAAVVARMIHLLLPADAGSLSLTAGLPSHAFALTSLVLLAAAMVRMLKRLSYGPGASSSWVRAVIDMALAMITIWAAGMTLAPDTGTPDGWWLLAAYPALAVAPVQVLVRASRRASRRDLPLLLLAGATLTAIVAELVRAWLAAMPNAIPGAHTVVYPIHALALFELTLAGLLQRMISPESAARHPDERRLFVSATAQMDANTRAASQLAPLVWIVLICAVFIVNVVRHAAQPSPAHLLTPAVALVTVVALVALRAWHSLMDSQQVTRQLGTVLRTSEILSLPIDPLSLPQLTLTELEGLIPFQHAALALWDHDGVIRLARHSPGHVLTPSEELTPEAAHLRAFANSGQATMAGSSTDAPDARERETARVMLSDARLRGGSWALMPLATNQRAVGLLALWHGDAHAYPPERMQMLAVFARQAAVVTESVQLRREEKRAAVMAERGRLANELHDSVSQAVFGSLLGIKVARETLDSDRDKSREALDYAERLADAAIVEMRALIFELRPETLQNEGLVNAMDKQVAALCKRHGLQAMFSAPHGEPALSGEAKESLYRIALEAVHNAVRHAHASAVEITLDDLPTHTVLSIADDGRGFDPQQVRSSAVGISGMRMHAEQMGALFALGAAPGTGTRITVTLPKGHA